MSGPDIVPEAAPVQRSGTTAKTEERPPADPGNAPVPPQQLEAEESVLGAMMMAPAAIEAVAEELRPDDFYRGSHARIFEAAVALHAAGEPVDAITVTAALEKAGELENVGGRQRLHELAALVPATANARHYARIVREHATLRGLIRVGGEVSRLGWERSGEPAELVEQAQEMIFSLGRQQERQELVPFGPGLRASYERLMELQARGREVIGLPTGFQGLDRLTSGLQPGNLIVLAARPSMGKSGLALGIVAHVALHAALPVALFTLEMSTEEVNQRILSAEATVDSLRLRNGKLGREDWGRVTNTVGRIHEAPLFIDDSGASTMIEVRARARRLLSHHPDLALVVIDYLQLMGSGTRQDNRVQEISQISRGLKLLAKELNVPILALSQLSRSVEGRHDKRPILSDLRESGSIEQDADLVAFIYRDEYYNPEDEEVAGIAELNLAKHRNGPTQTIKLTFVKQYAKFSDPVFPERSP
jgi:replicative DNA helicase